MLTKFDAFVGKIFVLVALLLIKSNKKEEEGILQAATSYLY